MHSENIAAYVGLDVHKETLAVAIVPERPSEIRYYGTSTEREKQSVLRASRLIRVLSVRLLRSMR
ncbi:TPA: hypothetical protein U0R94_004758 [Escherichia coli]|nr:hypothetical protein [Escherichia coli]HEM0129808.1 hypothetical protein [Escherichia coli]